ncbi:nose resistant to fluoxetine protein 6-like [Sabethes cyaneus]|uniref:nose resistant to fluoxetine protein 6-like n=1 Tax=Sabethes cyaneus TaxID=53552 RepID=UPI00237E69C9|nr:nose resistant to fluoxetine protein 6-like [Sabethes cyaneus]
MSSTKSKKKHKILDHGKLGEMDSKTIESNIIHNKRENNTKYKTSNEYWKEYKHIGIVSKILLCFAVGPNSKTILSVERANEDSITCVHGLRVYSLLWTIMVHTYLQLFAVGENRYGRKITERSFTYQVVGNATFSVDTFFFISGVLVVVLFYRTSQNFKEERSNEKRNFRGHRFLQEISRIFLSTLYRFLRLTPAYLFVIILNELALKWTYGRSVFTPGIIDHITCHEYWWRNILYINNWYPFSEMCMIWSWYLANDMQFYIIAIIMLSLAVRYFKTTTFVMLLLLACSWVTGIFISIKYNYSYKVAEPFESFDILYDKPWQRITPYIMGMLTGYIYYFKKTPPKVSRKVNIMLWTFSLATIFGLVFGVWNGKLSVPETALYVSLGHTAWGAALVWITLSCCWGYASTVNRILSYRGLYPLSRLSYCAYLLHPVVMMVTSFQMEAPMHLQHVMVVTVFFGNAVISFIMSYFVSVIFEAPVIKLLKIAFRK